MRNTTKRPKKPATTPRKRPLQENKKKEIKSVQILNETPPNESKTIQNEKEITSSESNQIQPQKETSPYKKKQYRAFMKLVRDGKYPSAVVPARLLGVDRSTILAWLKTKKVLQAMNEEVDSYVSKIQQSKDWKAQAYLLDKLEGNKEEKETNTELKQLIVINT